MAHDMVSQSWIIDRLKMYKISDKVFKFIAKAMKNWKVELTAGRKTFVEVKIQISSFPRGFTLALTISNSNEASQSHTEEVHWELQIYKITRNDQSLYKNGRHQAVWIKTKTKQKNKNLRSENQFFYLLRTFCPHFGSFYVVSSSLRFGQISTLAFFR